MNHNLKLSETQNCWNFHNPENHKITNDKKFSQIIDFNRMLFLNNFWLEKYLQLHNISCASEKLGIQNLLNMDQGGFDHGDLSGLYTSFQNSPRYSSTRLCGWNNLLSIAFNALQESDALQNGLILDFLAGSGTLSKKVKQLLPNNRPNVIGIDVSKKMVERAQDYQEIVFWGSHEFNPFKQKIADVAIAAYGFHHVPIEERNNFVLSMQKTLKKGGVCILHDFEEHSPTAQWYSKIIHLYRSVGHPYPHVTDDHLTKLLNPHFEAVEIKYLYDPFYLESKEGQDVQSLKQEFYAYLICLFNLDKLLPNDLDIEHLAEYKNLSYWQNIEEIFTPSFTLEKEKLKRVESKAIIQRENGPKIGITIPQVDQLTIQFLPNNKICLIAPRIALVGIGYKGK